MNVRRDRGPYSFSVVTTSEAFASLFSLYTLQDYRQKKPLGTSIPPCARSLRLEFMNNVG
jgi:hypothetical protein